MSSSFGYGTAVRDVARGPSSAEDFGTARSPIRYYRRACCGTQLTISFRTHNASALGATAGALSSGRSVISEVGCVSRGGALMCEGPLAVYSVIVRPSTWRATCRMTQFRHGTDCDVGLLPAYSQVG
jgi:hypothetical protein